jgi:hypothetical protein
VLLLIEGKRDAGNILGVYRSRTDAGENESKRVTTGGNRQGVIGNLY